jgi:hypothetical protein
VVGVWQPADDGSGQRLRFDFRYKSLPEGVTYHTHTDMGGGQQVDPDFQVGYHDLYLSSYGALAH